MSDAEAAAAYAERMVPSSFPIILDGRDALRAVYYVAYVAYLAGIAHEREEIAKMIERAGKADVDGNYSAELGGWDSEWYVLDQDKIIAAIRARSTEGV